MSLIYVYSSYELPRMNGKSILDIGSSVPQIHTDVNAVSIEAV